MTTRLDAAAPPPPRSVERSSQSALTRRAMLHADTCVMRPALAMSQKRIFWMRF
jgi:hypothetical protein